MTDILRWTALPLVLLLTLTGLLTLSGCSGEKESTEQFFLNDESSKVAVAAADSAGVLTGTVVDATTQRPIPGAIVEVSGPEQPKETDASGAFRFENISDDTLQVAVRFVGYHVANEEFVMPESGGLSVVIGLRPRTSELDEVMADEGVAQTRQRMTERALSPPPSPSRMMAPGRYAPPVDREGYDRIEETGFRRSTDAPQSTFSIDVDGAAYSNVRRFIRDGEEPPVDAVRIEEMLNYFPYDDPAPVEGSRHPFAVSMETAPAPWSEGHTLLRIGIQGEEIPETERPPTNLVFLLDVSGSMNSPNKLPLLKKAFRLLTEQLRPEDRVAIVVYAGASGTVLEPTPGNDKDAILGALNDLRAGGSTAGGAGIEAAYALAEKNFDPDGINRVILATDGDFNVGASSNAEMIRLIEEKRESGVFLTVLGFGTGNLQDSKMEQIANHGNGSYHYIDSALEARKVMVSEVGGTLQTIAKDVKLQVEFNPNHVGAYRLIGYENRRLAAEDFADDTKDAGELGAGHHVTALYELVPPGADSLAPEVPELKYQDREPSEAAASDEWLTLKLRYKEPEADESQLIQAPLVPSPTAEPSTDWQFAAAVAGFSMILRDSDYRGNVTLEQVRRLAENGRGDDPDGYRAGFIALLEDYRRMVEGEQGDAVRPGR